MDSVFFEPWVGGEYWSGGMFGKRIMVLGESHYCGSGCPDCGVGDRCRGFTTKVIKDYLDPNVKREEWMNTFKKFERSLVNRATSPPREREDLELCDVLQFPSGGDGWSSAGGGRRAVQECGEGVLLGA